MTDAQCCTFFLPYENKKHNKIIPKLTQNSRSFLAEVSEITAEQNLCYWY